MVHTGSNSHRKPKEIGPRLKGPSYVVIAIMSSLGILLCINQLFYLNIAGFMPIGNAYYYYILTFYLSISFIVFPGFNRDKNRVPWYDWGLFILCIATTCYLGLNAYNILTKGWEYTAPALPTLAGGILWMLALEGIRRAGGFSLFVICLVFSLYPLYAGFMPGFLWGSSFSLLGTVRYQSMGVEGIIGIPTRVVGNLLVGFIIFGVALVSSGGGKFFMDFALSLLGHTRGGGRKSLGIFKRLYGKPERKRYFKRGHNGFNDHTGHEKDRVQPQMGSCGGGLRLHRRIDHAAHNGSGRFPDRFFYECPIQGGYVGGLFPGLSLLFYPYPSGGLPCCLCRNRWAAKRSTAEKMGHTKRRVVLFGVSFSTDLYPCIHADRVMGAVLRYDISLCVCHDKEKNTLHMEEVR